MVILERLPPFSSEVTILIDTFFLIALLSPVLYFFMLRPLVLQITERKQAEDDIKEQKKFLDTIIESIPHPFYVISADDYTLKLRNSAAADLSAIEETPTSCYAHIHNKNKPCGNTEHICPLEKVKETKKSLVCEHSHYNKQGGLRYDEVHGCPIFDSEGNVIQMIEYSLDITERKQSERELKQAHEELKEAATTERLTKLLNRFSFEQDAKKLNNPVLLLIDIDRFRHINNFYGIEAGNLILKEFTNRLNVLIPKNLDANIYKLGGDDFGVLYEDNPGIDPKAIAEKIVEWIEEMDFTYQDYNISLSISIGISRERPILEKADMVLSYLKRHTRLKYKEYSEELSLYKNISENLRILNVLKKAISRDAIVSYFQPIVNNKTGIIEKYECLVRIIDEGNNVLSPFSFLEVAKEARLYGEITKRMIENGMAAFKDKDYEFSINISVEDINDSEVEEFITKALKKNPEIAHRITFEILESEGIENYEIVYAFIQKVKEYGCKIAIDDFGAGYSNFGRTMQLNIDYLKIDSSLIKEIVRNEKLQILTETIVNYAKRLGIKTIAEYVHSKEVYEKVIKLGVDYSQGYFLGEPKPTIEF